MKIKNKNILRFATMLILIFGAFLMTATAQEDCTDYYSLGSAVSVKYCNTKKIAWGTKREYIWYWVFRNDGTSKITDMEFTVLRTKDDYSTERKNEYLPLPIEVGGTRGGWAVFDVSSTSTPSITIKNIKRK